MHPILWPAHWQCFTKGCFCSGVTCGCSQGPCDARGWTGVTCIRVQGRKWLHTADPCLLPITTHHPHKHCKMVSEMWPCASEPVVCPSDPPLAWLACSWAEVGVRPAGQFAVRLGERWGSHSPGKNFMHNWTWWVCSRCLLENMPFSCQPKLGWTPVPSNPHLDYWPSGRSWGAASLWMPNVKRGA